MVPILPSKTEHRILYDGTCKKWSLEYHMVTATYLCKNSDSSDNWDISDMIDSSHSSHSSNSSDSSDKQIVKEKICDRKNSE